MLFGDVDCRNCILVVLVTATAVATTALVDTVQTQHFVNDWVQTASHMWNTQLRIHTRFESELAATKNTLLWEIYGGTDTEPTLTSNSLFATGMLLITVLLLLNIMTTHTWDLVKKKKSPPRSLEQCVTRHHPSPGTGYYYQSSPPSGHPSLRSSD